MRCAVCMCSASLRGRFVFLAGLRPRTCRSTCLSSSTTPRIVLLCCACVGRPAVCGCDVLAVLAVCRRTQQEPSKEANGSSSWLGRPLGTGGSLLCFMFFVRSGCVSLWQVLVGCGDAEAAHLQAGGAAQDRSAEGGQRGWC